MKKILVTGANGFIAKHIILELLKNNYKVRGTVRNISFSETIKSDIKKYFDSSFDIEFFKASLDSDKGWDEAVSGCDVILHTASPFPKKKPQNESDLINPAKEGTLRVLNAAKQNLVERVIITSSNAAVYDGNKHLTEFDEKNWTNINVKGVSAYTKSKTIAERAAWDFVVKNPLIKLSTINPVLVWGPAIGNHSNSTSLIICRMLMNKEMPMIPRMKVPLVDVRDVAKAHISSIENDNSIGNRFLLCENTYWMKDISLKMKKMGYNSPIIVAPDFVIKFLSNFDSTLKEASSKLGYDYSIKSNQAKNILSFDPIKVEKTIEDTCIYLQSLKGKR